ncbi:MAG: recombination mediator RecR [Candidatus Omnitrophota bacterium]
MSYPRVIENLIEQLTHLPGVGRRSAERMVFHLLNAPEENSHRFAEAILDLRAKLRFCRICNNFTEGDICTICADMTRNQAIICVVENPKDAIAIEKTGHYKGQYFVLLGAIAPSEGRGPDDVDLNKLIRRVVEDNSVVKEVVLATDADMEGELTALHIIKALQPYGVRISRIGIGLPAGGSVEFADISTLTMSLNARREVADMRTDPANKISAENCNHKCDRKNLKELHRSEK